MSKIEFINDRYDYLSREGAHIPAEWVAEGWNQQQFRGAVTCELSRSVSKVGGFGLVGELWLLILPKALTVDQTVELYEEIRELSERLEFEWRDEFIGIFPDAQGAIPSAKDTEFLTATLVGAIETEFGGDFEYFVEIAREVNPAILVDPVGPNGRTPLEMAAEKKRDAMRSFLEAAIGKKEHGV